MFTYFHHVDLLVLLPAQPIEPSTTTGTDTRVDIAMDTHLLVEVFHELPIYLYKMWIEASPLEVKQQSKYSNALFLSRILPVFSLRLVLRSLSRWISTSIF